MPPIAEFTSTTEYYSTLAHEMIHWTKPSSRVDRKQSETKAEYAFEELVAEIGACFVFANLDMAPDIEQSAAYVQSWLKALRDDKKFIFKAASLAQVAADYIDRVSVGRRLRANDERRATSAISQAEAFTHSSECADAKMAA